MVSPDRSIHNTSVYPAEKGSDSEHETDKNETGSESDQEENEEDVEDDEEEKDDELVKTSSNSTDDEDETNVEDKDEVNTDEGLIQKEGADAEMINVQQGNENLETTLNQVIKDAHVTLSTVTKKTEVPMQKSFLQWMFMSIMRVTTLEKEVAKLKTNDPLNTQVTALFDEHLDSRLGATIDEFMSYLSASITARITEQVKSQLPQILPKEVSNFASLVIKSIVTESLEHAKSSNNGCFSIEEKLKRKDKDEDPSPGSDEGAKSQSKSSGKSVQSEEPEFKVADSDMSQDQEDNLGNDDEEPKRKVASKHDWLTNLSGDDVSDFSIALRMFTQKLMCYFKRDDITKNIRMEYLSHRRWNSLEKKRVNIMIEAIDKQLKERRMMRSFEKKLVGDTTKLTCGYFNKQYDFVILCSPEAWLSMHMLRGSSTNGSKSENKGKVPTEMKLVLEQTQQGTSYEVSINAEGVEELKRKVKIKGEKKEAFLTLRQKPGQYICCQESQR
ncbi:hypothetical protein Tco_1165723 [Tanacetum coccineum]